VRGAVFRLHFLCRRRDKHLESVYPKIVDVLPCDRVLLSTEGLLDLDTVSNKEIELIISEGSEPEETANRMLSTATDGADRTAQYYFWRKK
jgi:serine/threonine protein phosphatase PrpC